ncbi:MAG: TlpA family protein disulfide reductase [Candidatus Bipolaricaulia bacterium]
MIKKLLVFMVVLLGLGVTSLITYSYFFIGRNQDASIRGETAVNSSALILRTSRGIFIDKAAEVNADLVAPYPGYRAPDFAFEDLDGNLVRLSDFRGKPVLLNFWATWCPPCRKEVPDLQAFHEQYGDKIVLLGIDWGEDEAEVNRFLKRYGATYTNLLDKNGQFFVLYQLTGLPTSYWIDDQGVIRGLWLGAMSLDDMVAGFEKTTYALEEGIDKER